MGSEIQPPSGALSVARIVARTRDHRRAHRAAETGRSPWQDARGPGSACRVPASGGGGAGSNPAGGTKPASFEPTVTRSPWAYSRSFSSVLTSTFPGQRRSLPRTPLAPSGGKGGVSVLRTRSNPSRTFWAPPPVCQSSAPSSCSIKLANGSVSSARSTEPSRAMNSLVKKPWLSCRRTWGGPGRSVGGSSRPRSAPPARWPPAHRRSCWSF